MTAYLRHVAAAWNGILQCGSEAFAPSIVDSTTVGKLESLAPKHSAIDRDMVLAMMQQRELFSSQHDENLRRTLAANICNHQGLIPSLWTFFETLKYLEPICEALRKLIGVKIKRTIRERLQGFYFAPAKTVVQVSRSKDMELTPNLSKEQAAFVSYVELWAFCARNFDGLTAFTPRMECSGTKPLVRGPNPVVWQCFAKFAISRGFITPRAKELSQDNSSSQLALDYLRKANPLTADFSNALVEKVVTASRPEANVDDDDDDDDLGTQDDFIKVERRSGRPYELDHARDKRNLYFAHLHSQTWGSINLSLVRQDLFRCIFGRLQLEVSFSQRL